MVLVEPSVRRAALLGAVLLALLGSLTACVLPAQGQPALRIRVPLVAELGDVPPAVIGSPTPVLDATYQVVDPDGAEVLSGTVTEGTVAASPHRDAEEVWPYFYVAPLVDLPEGRFRVRFNGVESAWFEVRSGAWQDVVRTLLPIYRANADGREPATPYHGPSHLHDARSRIANGPHAGDRVDVRGGWMDAGDQLKFTVTMAYATAMLELAGRNEPGLRDTLWRRAAIGVRFLLKAHPRRGIFVSQVGDVGSDHSGFRDPASDDDSDNELLAHRPSRVLTRRTGGSDVAAMAAAALALAARHHTGDARARLVRAAGAWLTQAEALGKVWRNCCYQQDTWRDDAAFAHAALWRTTGRERHAAAAVRLLRATTDDGESGWRVSADGYEVAALPAAELCGVLGAPAAPATYRRPACRILRAGGDHWSWEVGHRTAFGRAGVPLWGGARNHEAAAVTLLLADRVGPTDYTRALGRATGWFLGVNPWGVRLQVEGTAAGATVIGGVTGPYHWTTALDRPLPVGAVPGGPADQATVDSQRSYCCPPVVLRDHDTPQQVYHRGDSRDYVMNEIGLAYNAPALLHFALLSPG